MTFPLLSHSLGIFRVVFAWKVFWIFLHSWIIIFLFFSQMLYFQRSLSGPPGLKSVPHLIIAHHYISCYFPLGHFSQCKIVLFLYFTWASSSPPCKLYKERGFICLLLTVARLPQTWLHLVSVHPTFMVKHIYESRILLSQNRLMNCILEKPTRLSIASKWQDRIWTQVYLH